MNEEIKEIREYIACPQLGDNHYGKWGALRLDQRIKIKQLLDNITNLQQRVKQLEEENEKLKYLVDDNHIMKAFIVEHNKVEQLENIRKETMEYVRKHPCNTWYYTKERDNTQTFGNREVIRCDTELLNILNKGSKSDVKD